VKTHTRPPRLSESDGGQVYSLCLPAIGFALGEAGGSWCLGGYLNSYGKVILKSL